MTTRIIVTEQDRIVFTRFIEDHSLPMTVTVVAGKKRSLIQNKLQRKWCNEISEQLGDKKPEEIRGFCKLTIGVPILRSEDDVFCEKYDRIIKPHTYEQKLEMMMEPLDFPVTRLMTTKQNTRYLDDFYKYWSERGLVLTDPNARGREDDD